MKKLINISKPSKKGYLILFSIFCGLSSFSQEERIVNSLPEVLHLSKEKNYALQNATLQTQLANLTKKNRDWKCIKSKNTSNRSIPE